MHCVIVSSAINLGVQAVQAIYPQFLYFCRPDPLLAAWVLQALCQRSHCLISSQTYKNLHFFTAMLHALVLFLPDFITVTAWQRNPSSTPICFVIALCNYSCAALVK